MISIFVPIRKGSKRVKNKNIKRFNKYKLGLTELKILQLKRLKEKVVKKKFFNHDFSANLIGKFVYCKKKGWISHDSKKIKWPRTQDLKPLFSMNSAAIISEREVYINKKDRLCKSPLPILSNLKEGFDVDNNKDFEIVSNKKKIPI